MSSNKRYGRERARDTDIVDACIEGRRYSTSPTSRMGWGARGGEEREPASVG